MVTVETDSSPALGRSFLLRACLLVALLAAFNLWLVRHTGRGWEDPRAIGSLAGLVMLVLGIMEKVFSTVDESIAKRIYRTVVDFALDGRVLGLAYLAAAFLMLNLSSIVIIEEGASASATPTVAPIGSTVGIQEWSCERGKGPWRYCLWTGPFGSNYRVSVDGYMPQVVEVFPLTGRRIVPSRDLKRSPTALIRPSVDGLNSLNRCEPVEGQPNKQRCGEFTLCRLEENACDVILRLENHAGSFLIGWPKAVPPGLIHDWRLELLAAGKDETRDAQVFSDTLLKWKYHRAFVPNRADDAIAALEVGSRWRAQVRAKTEERGMVDCLEFTVEDKPFMDLAMRSTVDSGECPP